MFSVKKVRSVTYYTTGAGASQGASSYYLDAVAEGEPPGRWLGKGAAALGLEGEVDAQVMETVYGEFKNPLTGEQIGRRPDKPRSLDDRIAAGLAAEPDALPERQEEIRRDIERSARKGVLGWDTTFNVAKSVSIVHTALHRAEITAIRDGDTERAQRAGTARRAIEHAILRANDTGMSTLEGLLTVRTGSGSGAPMRWESAQGATIASFFQHTNRDADPHLHVHNVFLNRAAGQDGKYRALDGEDLLAQRFHGAAVSDRVMWEELAKLGLESIPRKDGMGRELVLVPAEVNDFFSGRRQQITKALKPLMEAAEERLGRALSQRERYELAQQATLATRAAKKHGVTFTVEETVDRWQNRLITGTGQTLTTIAEHAMNVMAAGPIAAQEWSPESVIAESVAACAARSATWGRANLVNEMELRLPILGIDPDEVPALLDRLADQALASPDVVQVAGRDAGDYARPSATLYAAASTLTAEKALREAAMERTGYALDPVALKVWLDEYAPTLGVDQRAVIEGLATSDAALSVLIGPAGSGKSFTAGTFAAAWADQTDGAGRVIGLATSEVATKVLMDDGIAASRNIRQWLDAQAAITEGSTDPRATEWALGPRDVVMVDEASMVSTAHLDAIREHVQAVGARLVLTGDPRQLSAVGAGGVMGLLDGHAETYTLTEIRRFREEWEREASLRLRAGDLAALAEYDRHGRLIAADTLDDAVARAARAAVADRMDDRTTVVVASTNDLAAQIAGAVREQLIELGQVEAAGVRLGRDGNTGGVGDVVMCRQNDYRIGVTNRAQYRVLDVTDSGGLIVQQLPRPGQHRPVSTAPIQIPAAYVAEDVQLGYAGTVHAAEGLTVDNGYWVTAGGDKLSAAYVAATRGRIRNTVFVALDTPVAADDLPAAAGRGGGATRLDDADTRASALAVLEASLDRTTGGASATVTAETDAARAQHLETLAGRFEVEVHAACRDRLERQLDDLTADGTLDPDIRGRLAADQGSKHLARLLRAVEQAGHDPARTLREAITAGQLDDATSVAQVLSHRITRGGQPLDLPTADTAATTRIPAGLDPDQTSRLAELAARIDSRRDQLGHQIAEQAPEWAVQAFGPVPPEADVADRADWQTRAGQVGAHREATGWNHPEQALGIMPGLSMPERRADYATAWHALGQPPERLGETDMSTGQLLARHRAWANEQAWAPPHADHALRGAEQAAETARQEAALAQAEGRTSDAARLRAEAEHQAGSARAYARVVEARGTWAERTAYTRIFGETAGAELTRRGITPGKEADRTTARTYLNPAGTPDSDGLDANRDTAHLDELAAERARILADDNAHRTITDADVTDLHPDDHAWAARTASDEPETRVQPAVHVPSAPYQVGESPAYQVAEPGMSRVQLDVLLTQAQLALTIAIDQASQDHANELADQPNRTIEAYDAGRRRRDAAELDAQAQGYDAGTEAGSDLYLDPSPDTEFDLTQEDSA